MPPISDSIDGRQDENEIDGCEHVLQRTSFSDDMRDDQLPAGAGGVQPIDQNRAGNDRVDGCVCGLEHDDEEDTKDEELPVAVGGVA